MKYQWMNYHTDGRKRQVCETKVGKQKSKKNKKEIEKLYLKFRRNCILIWSWHVFAL